MLRVCFAAGALAAAVPTAGAASLLVGDFSFEGIAKTNASPGLFVLSTNHSNLGQWITESAGLVSLSTSVRSGVGLGGRASSHGSYHAAIVAPLAVGGRASLQQTLGQTFQPNMRYSLTVDVDQGALLDLVAGASLQLRAGSTTVASLNGLQLASLVDSANGWQTVTLDYTTGVNAPLGNIGIRFELASLVTLGGTVYLDQFTLSATTLVVPVPEPAGLALPGGAALMVWRHWIGRRRASSRIGRKPEAADCRCVSRSSSA